MLLRGELSIMLRRRKRLVVGWQRILQLNKRWRPCHGGAARKLRTKKGRETYSKRESIVEPVFGQIKGVRGFVQFSLWGLEKMRGEWSLVCLMHNLLKLFAARCAVAA